jgi:hypothetical protein
MCNISRVQNCNCFDRRLSAVVWCVDGRFRVHQYRTITLVNKYLSVSLIKSSLIYLWSKGCSDEVNTTE